MKRQIKSEAELVSALCKGVEVEELTYNIENKTKEWSKTKSKIITASKMYRVKSNQFRYSDPVEVVELWGLLDEFDNWDFQTHNDSIRYCTHKQTQIIQNGEIIWTETIKIK